VSTSRRPVADLSPTLNESGRSPDFPAKQRGRDDVSSATGAVAEAERFPTASNATAALDAGGSVPLLPTGMYVDYRRPRLLTADDVAVILRVPRSLIYALVRRGELPAIRIGERYVRFREEAIERWLEHREGADAYPPDPSVPRGTIERTRGSSPTIDRGASDTSLRRRANASEPGIRRVGPDAS
jgi:excisionase family DNA binding protein